MNFVKIPAWNDMLVLPPVNDGNAASADRSPYEVSLLSFVRRFATTPARCTILRGLLEFRQSIHEAGITAGFQWVDGSFVEDVEARYGRGPRDLDVVTFVLSHESGDPQQIPPNLLDLERLKSSFAVDNYWVQSRNERALVKATTYWYSMWSHRRDRQWKGYVQLDLDAEFDSASLAELREVETHLHKSALQARFPDH